MRAIVAAVHHDPHGNPLPMLDNVDIAPADVVFARRCLARNGALDLAERIGLAS